MNEFGLKTEPNYINAQGTACEIVKSFGITSPDEIDLESIAMARGVLVMDAILKGAEARLVRNENKGIIRVSNETREVGKRRFSIAHELGHWELHPHVTQVDLYSDSNISSYWGSNEEKEANAFASELLMPSYLFRPKCLDIAPNLKGINRLAEEFNTTLTSAVLRFIEETEWPCAVVFSEGGVIKWWKASKSCKEIYFQSKQEIQPYTLAWCYENGKEVPEDGERIEAELWLNERYSSEYEKIFEQSIKLGAYKTILTLLWLD